jgi:hypothetical protein
MSFLFPEIEPYEHGLLDTGYGNLIYWEACGNPVGKPALVLHGVDQAPAAPPLRAAISTRPFTASSFSISAIAGAACRTLPMLRLTSPATRPLISSRI